MANTFLFRYCDKTPGYINRHIPVALRNYFLTARFCPQNIHDYTDLLYLPKKKQKQIRHGNKFLIIDSYHEGYSTFYGNGPLYKDIYSAIEHYKIPYEKVIFVTMNLVEKSNLNRYVQENNKPPIHCIAECFAQCDVIRFFASHINLSYYTRGVEKEFSDKFLLSLNNRYRQPRASLAFYLDSSEIAKNCLSSHNEPYLNFPLINFPDRSQKSQKRWMKSLPKIIDGRDTFNRKLHQQTLFQIVNETLVDDEFNTSRELSEKTFLPVLAYQPFLIYGQKNSNKTLESLGYQLYHDWFDYDFDIVTDPIERYMQLFQSVKSIFTKLQNCSRKEQIAWRFQNKSVLEHNLYTLKNNAKQIDKKVKGTFSDIVIGY